MRPIYKVIKAIQTQIPVDFERRADLLDALNDISETSASTVPELMQHNWDKLSNTLAAYLRVPNCDWKIEILKIKSGVKDYKQFLIEEDL